MSHASSAHKIARTSHRVYVRLSRECDLSYIHIATTFASSVWDMAGFVNNEQEPRLFLETGVVA